MQEPDEPEQNVPNLTFLRRLVTILTLTMIGGILALVTLIFIRFQGEAKPCFDSTEVELLLAIIWRAAT